MNDHSNIKIVEPESLLKKVNKKPYLFQELVSWIKIFISCIIIVLLLQRFVLMSAEVHGRSMYPTLEDGERVILWSLLYQPNHFDIIIMEHFTGDNYVKRIIGLEGDHVKYVDGQLYLNNRPVEEPQIFDASTGQDFTLQEICQFNQCDEIPVGYLLVLGDNRNNSEDSRNFGLVHESQLKGRVIFRYWPFTRIGMLH